MYYYENQPTPIFRFLIFGKLRQIVSGCDTPGRAGAGRQAGQLRGALKILHTNHVFPEVFWKKPIMKRPKKLHFFFVSVTFRVTTTHSVVGIRADRCPNSSLFGVCWPYSSSVPQNPIRETSIRCNGGWNYRSSQRLLRLTFNHILVFGYPSFSFQQCSPSSTKNA